MTSEGLGEIFEGDYADMCAGKFLLMLMGGQAEGLPCADPGARTPIGVSRIPYFSFLFNVFPNKFWGNKLLRPNIRGFIIAALKPNKTSESMD